MSSLQALTITTISAAVLFGLVLALLGSLKLALARHLHIGEGRVGLLISVLNLALIPMMLLCGVLIDVLGIRVALLLGSFLTAAALLAIGLSPTYRRALLASFVAGLGSAALLTAALVLMPHAFFDRTSNREWTPGLNLGFVFIALGALLTPALIDVLRGILSFRRMMILLAILALTPGVLSLVPPFSDALVELQAKVALQNADRPAFSLLSSQNVSHLALAALVFFFYAPLEAAIAVWTTTYLTDHGSTETEAAFLLSGFWTMFMLSRLVVAFVQPEQRYDPWFICLGALCTAAMLGNLAGTASPSVGRLGILMLGLFMGPIFPGLLGIVFREFPAERGTAHGVIFAVGSTAALLLGPIMGVRIQRGSHSVFTIPLILSIGLFLAAVVFGMTVGAGGRR